MMGAQSEERLPSVVLASMPWAPVTEPSLALGILVAQLRAHGIRARSLHLNVDLLEHVSFETYVKVAEFWGLDEFVFSESLSPGIDDPQLNALVDRCVDHLSGDHAEDKYATPEALLEMLLKFRMDVAPAFIANCAQRVLAQTPTMVGLTCMFDQTIASVALAKAIKAASPDVLIVLGGYAVQGAPGEEVLKAFPWVDAIARGDGEDAILKLAAASVGQFPLEEIDGVLVRGAPARPNRNVSLEKSPDPDYADWFDDVARLKDQAQVKVVTGTLPVESSRGCWWGQHSHCVFCGIDDETLKFRHKSAERAYDMLENMHATYGDLEYRFSDYILPKPYFERLLPRLAARKPRHRLKCEIKANQSLDRVDALSQAGFKEVQPGIESFSSDVLKLMDKGVSGIQNVSLLKQGYVHEIVVHYNFLYGIPGELPQHYKEMRANIPRIYHLTPPVSRSEAIVTRFAPLQADPQRFGYKTEPVHHRCYDVLFSRAMLESSQFNLDNYCYYFARYEDFRDEMRDLYDQCVAQINHWKKQHRDREVSLDFEDDAGRLLFRDSRFEDEQTISVSGLARSVYLGADSPIGLERLQTQLRREGQASATDLDDAVAELDEQRLIWREDDRILGLGIARPIARQRLDSGWREQWISIYR